MIPRCHLLTVSHAKDFPWFWYCVTSFRRFCAHPQPDWTVVVPNTDLELFKPFCDQQNVTVMGFDQPQGKGFLSHLVLKCCADFLCAGAEAVMHVDSDYFFKEPFSTDCWFSDGLPHLHKERYEDFREVHPNRYSWKSCVDRAIGGDNEWETMVRIPHIYWADLYHQVRTFIELTNRIPFQDYVLSCKPDYPQGFAEHPTLGAFALRYCPERYQQAVNIGLHGAIRSDVIDRTLWKRGNGWVNLGPVFNPIIQWWSWGGLDGPTDRATGGTPRQIMDRILAQ